MVTFIVILCLAFVAYGILMAIAMFVNTAMILLPWTITATTLGALAGFVVGTKFKMEDSHRTLVGAFLAFLLVFALGYAGLAIVPAKVPPAANNPGDLFKPPTDGDLAGMTPIHLGISSVIGAAAVALMLGCLPRKRLILEIDDTEPATA